MKDVMAPFCSIACGVQQGGRIKYIPQAKQPRAGPARRGRGRGALISTQGGGGALIMMHTLIMAVMHAMRTLPMAATRTLIAIVRC